MYQMTQGNRSKQSVHKQVVMTADFYSALRSYRGFLSSYSGYLHPSGPVRM